MQTTQAYKIPGPAGVIELQLTLPQQQIERLAVLCHPHPLYGGSMHDGVLEIAATTLLAQGIGVVRFNFRGVGDSQGISGRGTDDERQQASYKPVEIGDLLAVLDWVSTEHPSANAFGVGYSFGANVLWQAQPLCGMEQMLLIAPPTAAMAFDAHPTAKAKQVAAVWCAADDIVDPKRFDADPEVACTELAGGDHFFSGQAYALTESVIAFLKQAQSINRE